MFYALFRTYNITFRAFFDGFNYSLLFNGWNIHQRIAHMAIFAQAFNDLNGVIVTFENIVYFFSHFTSTSSSSSFFSSLLFDVFKQQT